MRIIVPALLCVLMCTRGYAPIWGFYPGLGSLDARAEAIAVIELLPRPPVVHPEHYDPLFELNNAEWDSTVHWPHPVRVKSVIKGTLQEGKETSMSLRFLPMSTREMQDNIPAAALDYGPNPMQARYGCYVAFLENTTRTTSSTAHWASLGCQGSLLAVPCDAELKKRPDESSLDCVRRLIGAK